MGNFIDLGKGPFSKKVINIDQQRTLEEQYVNMKKKAQSNTEFIQRKYLWSFLVLKLL